MSSAKLYFTIVLTVFILHVNAQQDCYKRLSFLIEYSIGFTDKNTLIRYDSKPTSGGLSGGSQSLYGNHLITVGSRYRLTENNLVLQASLSTGIGDNRYTESITTVGYGSESDKYEEFFEVHSNELTAELMLSKRLIDTEKVSLEIGTGGYYRNHTLDYFTGLNTRISDKNGITLNEGTTKSYQSSTLGYLFSSSVNLKIPKYKSNIYLRGVGHFGEEFPRFSVRAGIIFHL